MKQQKYLNARALPAQSVFQTILLPLQYVLSCGMDSMVKLWELSTNRCLIVYTGAGATGAMTHGTAACFNHTEDYGNVNYDFIF